MHGGAMSMKKAELHSHELHSVPMLTFSPYSCLKFKDSVSHFIG